MFKAIASPFLLNIAMETLRLHVGDDFVLRLPGRSMAGYNWTLRMNSADAVVSITHDVVAPTSAGVASMQSADEAFTLHGASVGNVQLQFELRRSWENDIPAAEQRMFDVEVLPREKGKTANAP